MFRIDVDGFTIWGERPRRVPAPVFLEPDGMTGWDDTPDLRRDSTERSNAHGEFDAAGYYTARTAAFSGLVVTDSARETAAIGRRMRGLLNGGQLGRVTVQRDDVTEWADGRLASSTKFRIHGNDPTAADWQMQFWFPKPFKYGDMQTAGPVAGGTAARIFHYGNAEALSTIVVEGSDSDGYVILGPNGRRYEVNTALVSGQPHTINMATGELLVGGIPRFGVLGSADTFTIPSGLVVSATLSGTSSSNRMTVNTFDTYV